LEKLKRTKEAEPHYRAAVKARPDVVVFRRNLGLALARLRQWAAAAPELDMAWRASTADVKLALALAEACHHAGNTRRSEEVLKRTVEVAPQVAPAWFNLGVYRSALGDRDGAEAAYARVLALTPNDVDALASYGQIRLERGDTSGAKEAFLRWAGLSPGSHAAHLNLAGAAVRAGDRATALDAWRTCLTLIPEDRRVRLDYANLLLEDGQTAAAVTEYRRLLAKDRNDRDVLDGLGLAFVLLSRWPEAEAVLATRLGLAPVNVHTLNNLAIVMARTNRRAKAIEYLERARAVDPDNASVRDNLQRLKTAS
jgi:superkiller protein 3